MSHLNKDNNNLYVIVDLLVQIADDCPGINLVSSKDTVIHININEAQYA